MFENIKDRTWYARYYLPKVETKDYNVMIDGQNVFSQPVKKKKDHMISHKQNEGRNINDNATMFFVIEEAILDF